MSTSNPACIIRDLSTGIVHRCVMDAKVEKHGASTLGANLERRTWIHHYMCCGLGVWEDRKWRKRNRHRQADKGALGRLVDAPVTCIECLAGRH